MTVDKLMKNVFLIAVIVLFSSCSISKKMERHYEGSTRDLLLKEMGEPNKIVKLQDGNEQFIYEKEKFIRETPISTGSFTLDQRISPSFTKVEVFKFIIDPNGVIRSTAYEKFIK